MEENLDNINEFLIRIISTKKSKKIKIKKSKKTGTILISPIILEKESNFNKTLTYEEYNDGILEFENILRENFRDHCNLSSFYRNIKKLVINDNKNNFISKVKKLFRISKDGNFFPKTNKIELADETVNKETLFHELLHLSSTKKTEEETIFSGFCQIKGRSTIGIYLNEGYTEYLNCKYFSKNENSVYYKDHRTIARGIEDIIGEKEMERLYFDSDLKGLIIALSKYANEEEIMTIIRKMDILANNPSKVKKLYSEIRTDISKLKITKAEKLFKGKKITKEEKEKQILFAKLYALEGFTFDKDAQIKKEDDGIRITDKNNNIFIDNDANLWFNELLKGEKVKVKGEKYARKNE